MATVSLLLDESLKARLEALAHQRGMTMRTLIRGIIVETVEGIEREEQIHVLAAALWPTGC